MQADIKAIAEMMNEAAEETKKIAEEAKAKVNANAEEQKKIEEADDELYSIALDVKNEEYGDEGEFVREYSDQDFKLFLKSIVAKYNLKSYKIVTMNGRDGIPLVQFVGSKEALNDMWQKWYMNDRDDLGPLLDCDFQEAEDEAVNEATPMVTVDDKYIETALAGLATLQKDNPHAYEMAVTYLDRNKGRQLIPVEDFIARRLELANAKPEPADTRTTDQKRADALAKASNSWEEFKKQQADELAAKRV